jgi:RES domain-containing protein
MRRYWRIVSPAFADTAFSGEGARLYGGRWNSKGIRAVYLAERRSLALLERLVQDAALNADMVLIPVQIEETEPFEIVAIDDLPVDWRNLEGISATRAIGDAWLKSKSTLGLSVPSAVLPSERNLVLNPLHEGFARLKIGPPEPVQMDRRLLEKR